MLTQTKGPGRKTRAFLRFTLRYGKVIWAVAILLGIPAAWRTAMLYVHLKSDLEELLPRDSASVIALDEMRTRNPGLQYLGVLVDTGDAQGLPKGEKFIDDLAERIRKYPPDMVREVRTGTSEEHAFLEKHAALYVDLKDLKEIRKRIEARRDWEVSQATGASLEDDDKPPSIDMSDFEKKYDERIGGASGGKKSDRFSSESDHLTLLFVQTAGHSSGTENARVLLERVQADVAALGVEKYGPGMRVGYASDVAVGVEELEALKVDLSISSVLVVGAVMAVIILYFRWWRAIPVVFPPLLLAAFYSFGLASLPLFGVTDLNSNTAFLGSIIIGNGINYGLLFLARYREERARGQTVEEALAWGVWGARTGTLAAALAAGTSYASLVITNFRGFRQFGYIGGIGMAMSWITAFVLMPPLIHWLDRDPKVKTATDDDSADRVSNPPSRPSRDIIRGSFGSVMKKLVATIERAPALITIVALVITAGSIYKATRFDPQTQLEHDFSKLRRYDTWTSGEGYWGKRMDNLLGRYLTPTVVMTTTKEEADATEARLRESVDHGALKRYVASVRGIDDVLPKDQAAKIEEVKGIREALTPKVRSSIPDDKRERLDQILGDESLTTVTVDQLPSTFLTGLRERDGTVGKQVILFPRPNDTLWQAAAMHEFVDTLRGLSGDGRVAGSIPLSSDIMRCIMRDAPIASSASLIGVIIVVVLLLRVSRATLYTLGSLMVGVLWMAAATFALHVKINFANFVAFPITFGIGVDYAVNVMARYAQDGEDDISGAVHSTGGAVALCSATTIIGYSSLLLAKTRALFLFGLVAVLGEVACLTTALLALPAVLVLLRNRRRRRG